MRDWDRDGFPDPIPTNWRDYTIAGGGGCGCLVWLAIIAIIVYVVLNA